MKYSKNREDSVKTEREQHEMLRCYKPCKLLCKHCSSYVSLVEQPRACNQVFQLDQLFIGYHSPQPRCHLPSVTPPTLQGEYLPCIFNYDDCKALPSMPNRIFLSPLSFKTDLATSLFSMYLKNLYNFVL